MVIDSVAFHFRHDFDDYVARTCILTSMAQALMSLADEYRIAVRALSFSFALHPSLISKQSLCSCAAPQKVVLMNQVTTKVTERGQDKAGERESNQLIPALGESWSHACTNRLNLYWHGGQRYAHLQKCPSMASKTVPFAILVDGTRDITVTSL